MVHFRIQQCLVALIAGIFFSHNVVQSAAIGVEARSNQSSSEDSSGLAAGTNLSEFRSTITDLGHTLVALSTFEADDLAGLDALILSQPGGTPSSSPFSATEIAAIQANGNASIVPNLITQYASFLKGCSDQGVVQWLN